MSEETGGRRPAPPAGALLELRKVSKHFGAVQVLYDVDFHVAAGEVMALVGDNGAGKSTLIKCIAGIHPIDGGEVLFDGKPVNIAGQDASDLGIESSTGPRAATTSTCPEHVSRREDRLVAASTRPRWKAPSRPSGLSVTKSSRAPTSPGSREATPVRRGGQAVMWNSALVILDGRRGAGVPIPLIARVATPREQGPRHPHFPHPARHFPVADPSGLLLPNVAEFKRRDNTTGRGHHLRKLSSARPGKGVLP